MAYKTEIRKKTTAETINVLFLKFNEQDSSDIEYIKLFTLKDEDRTIYLKSGNSQNFHNIYYELEVGKFHRGKVQLHSEFKDEDWGMTIPEELIKEFELAKKEQKGNIVKQKANKQQRADEQKAVNGELTRHYCAFGKHSSAALYLPSQH